MVKAKKRNVGRPVGPAKKVSDAARIRKVLARYGIDTPAAKIKKVLIRQDKAFEKQGKALDVKISQVRSTLQAQAGLYTRKGKGRMSNAEKEVVERQLAKKAKKETMTDTEKELVALRLQLGKAKKQLANLKSLVVESQLAETQVAEVPVADAPVAAPVVAEVPVADAPAPAPAAAA
jgi:hypothetical protein